MGKERVIYASGEFRWFRQVHSKKPLSSLCSSFPLFGVNHRHEFCYFCFISFWIFYLLEIVYTYIYRQINLFFNKILNVLGLWDSFGSCE